MAREIRRKARVVARGAETEMTLFRGLSAFPLTPADARGTVDAEALRRLLERLASAGVDSIGLLGSTGIYAYLTRAERRRALATAVTCLRGKTPLMVGIGALRTDAAQDLASDAAEAGADALLLAPMSYTPLTQDDVYQHVRAVAETTPLPLCIYNNPGTTHFSFGRDLIARLGALETIRAIKMPLPPDGDYAGELAALRAGAPLAIGYSGDWGAADALLSGADAFYSVMAGLFPKIGLALARSAQAGDVAQARRIDERLQPLWGAFKTYGSLRVMYVALEVLGFGPFSPPRPILSLQGEPRDAVARIAESLRTWEGIETPALGDT